MPTQAPRAEIEGVADGVASGDVEGLTVCVRLTDAVLEADFVVVILADTDAECDGERVVLELPLTDLLTVTDADTDGLLLAAVVGAEDAVDSDVARPLEGEGLTEEEPVVTAVVCAVTVVTAPGSAEATALRVAVGVVTMMTIGSMEIVADGVPAADSV